MDSYLPVFRHVALGLELDALAQDQSAWSQATFGTDDVKGPLGSLKHLANESSEAIEAFLDWSRANRDIYTADDVVVELRQDYHIELADILILLLDASRRSGLMPLDLIRVAQAKMDVNKQRKWNVPQGDEPTEHVRDEE